MCLTSPHHHITTSPHHHLATCNVSELPRDSLHLLLALVDCRHAVRRPRSLRLRGPVRETCAWRRAAPDLERNLARTAGSCVETGPQQGRLDLLRRLPAQAAAATGGSAAGARGQCRRAADAAV